MPLVMLYAAREGGGGFLALEAFILIGVVLFSIKELTNWNAAGTRKYWSSGWAWLDWCAKRALIRLEKSPSIPPKQTCERKEPYCSPPIRHTNEKSPTAAQKQTHEHSWSSGST